MPYSRSPQEIIEAIEVALRSSPLPGVAWEPQPQCLVQELSPGHIRYSAVVWLTKPGLDVEPVSAVLNRIYFALERAGIPASEISYLVETRTAATPAEEASPADILRRTPIFRLLEDKDLGELAGKLHRLSFAPGEHILRQGDAGDSMYFVVAGRVSIAYRAVDGFETDLATFESGDFFGEASLLTGEARTATATAISRVTCYRLDKAGLQHTMELQPDLAEDMSVIAAHLARLSFRTRARSWIAKRLCGARLKARLRMLARIRRFFGIGSSSAGV